MVRRRRLAAAGNVAAMLELANGLAKGGLGHPRLETLAIMWWQKGAMLGNAECMRHLGECFYHGQGVEQDYGTAMKWFKQAADMGDKIALAGLSVMYERGYGAPASLVKALIYCKHAAARGASYIDIVSPFSEASDCSPDSLPTETARRLEVSIAADPALVRDIFREAVDIQLRAADAVLAARKREDAGAAAVRSLAEYKHLAERLAAENDNLKRAADSRNAPRIRVRVIPLREHDKL